MDANTPLIRATGVSGDGHVVDAAIAADREGIPDRVVGNAGQFLHLQTHGS